MAGVLARLGFRNVPQQDPIQMVDLEANRDDPGLPAMTCLQALKDNKWRALTICLLVVAVALCIYFGVKNSQQPDTCLDPSCLWVGAQRVAAADTSVSPCDNFFQYACGGHRSKDPLHSVNPNSNLTTDKLHEMLLDQPKGEKEDSADSKLRRLYRSCLSSETKSKEAARKLLGHLQQMGGWWLVPYWDPGSFDLQRTLEYSFDTLDLDLFWKIGGTYISQDVDLLAIIPRPLMRIPDGKEGQILFEEYVATIAELYLRDMTDDAVVTVKERIKLFVSDVINMKRMLENVGVPSSISKEIKEWRDGYTLFPENHGMDLDWKQLVHAKLGVWKRATNLFSFLDFEVSRKWITQLKSMTDDEEKRMLNSYIVWQILENFITTMPLEYRNVKETFEHKVGWGGEEDRRESCQLVLKDCLSEPLGSLYTRHYSETKSKQMVTEMAELMREEFLKDIPKYPWMDEETKEAAIYKLQKTDIVVEYPEQLKNETLIDSYYEGLQIPDGALFIDNYVAVKAFQHIIKGRLMKGESLDMYLVGRTFDPDIQSPPLANLLGIPVLELPVFGTSLPMHVNMASVGSKLGYSLDGLIEKYRGSWMEGLKEKFVLSWKSVENWLRILKQSSCLDNLTSPAPPQPWDKSGLESSKSRKEALITEITAIRLAYKAYKTWREQHASVPEKVIPGIDLNPEQSFFMTYAQMKCSMKREIDDGTISTPDRVNFALGQLPEFAEAFRCGRSPMNPEDKCVLKILQPSQT